MGKHDLSEKRACQDGSVSLLQEEEAALRAEEEAKQREEDKKRRKEEKAKERAELKRKGLLLTGKEKAEAERLAAIREQMLKDNPDIELPAGTPPAISICAPMYAALHALHGGLVICPG